MALRGPDFVTPTRTGYAIGIGAQKCASSWLHDVLATHPQIAAAPAKEVDFFSHRFDRGYRWYARQFPASGGLRFECSPSYLCDPRSPGRVAAFAPEARIVAVLRDPVERAYSNHLHEIARGHVPPVPFAEGLSNNPGYIDRGHYAVHLARWYAAFPAGRILCLFAEDIARAPQRAARRVYRHLGIAEDHATGLIGERRNVSDRARSPILRSALRAGGGAMRGAGLGEALAHAKRLPPVSRLLALNSVDLRRLVPPLSPRERADLWDVFRPGLDDLRRLVGVAELPWVIPAAAPRELQPAE